MDAGVLAAFLTILGGLGAYTAWLVKYVLGSKDKRIAQLERTVVTLTKELNRQSAVGRHVAHALADDEAV